MPSTKHTRESQKRALACMSEPKQVRAVAKAAVAGVVMAGLHTTFVWWLWLHINPYAPTSLGMRATVAATAVIGPAFFFALNFGFLVVFVLDAAYLTIVFWLASVWWRRRRAGRALVHRTS